MRQRTRQKKSGSKQPWGLLVMIVLVAYAPLLLLMVEEGSKRISSSIDISPPLIKSTKRRMSMPENPRIYIIHVGKAGGISLINSLQLIDRMLSDEIQCRMNKTRDGEDDDACFSPTSDDSQLARHTIGYFHMWGVNRPEDERRWLLKKTNTFLFTARDPIDRLISSYNYHRDYFQNTTKHANYKRFYKDCFPRGLDAMIDILRNDKDNSCTKLGLRALTGGFGGGWHFELNYQYYKKYSMDAWPNHAVAVVRTEHMQQDLAQLDELLGGKGQFKDEKHAHGSGRYAVPYSAHLSPSNTVFLCCLIYREMEAYQTMILKAFNLDDFQKRDSLSNLLNRCQIKKASEGNDLLQKPFPWASFRLGETCTGFLGDVENERKPGADYVTTLLQSARGYVDGQKKITK